MSHTSTSRNRRRSMPWVIAAIAILVFAAVRARRRTPGAAAALASAVAGKPSITVSRGDIHRYVYASGRLDPVRTRIVSPDMPGKVTSLKVHEGSTVSSGAMLCEVSGTRLDAPMAGLVTQVSVEEGGFAAPGQPAFVIMDTSAYRASIEIDEIDLPKVAVGMPATITFDAAPDLAVSGKVASIGAVAIARGELVTIPVRIAIDSSDPALKPGITANVQVDSDTIVDVVRIPARSWVELDGAKYAIRLDDAGVPSLAKIDVGLTDGKYTQVLSGVDEGAVIIEDAVSIQDKLPGAKANQRVIRFGPGRASE
ncbi:MAG: efflux RND transporter periplasmic adaptor subunit [Clostridia bacterium]|nr:efflux RND transporter periplasmic adaptor subunit [Clostridia bacterium]